MRWTMLFILFLVRLAMGYQFQSVASTSDQLIAQFGLSYAQVGMLIGFFLIPGIFIAIPSGALTQAFADKKLLMVGACAMTIGGVVMGLSTSADSLFVGRLLTGVGGTIFNLILTKMVTEWFFEREIVLALSIMLVAWPIGIALGLLTHGPIAHAYGWHWVMYATAIFALLALLLTAAFYRAPPAEKAPLKQPLRFTLPARQLVHMSVVGIGWTSYNACLIVLVSFAPGVLTASGYERGVAHSVISLFMWATLISLPLGGRVLGALKSTTSAIVGSLLIGAALVTALAFGFPPVLMSILIGLVLGIPAGALMSLSAQAVSANNRGPGLGVFYTWYYLGMTAAPAAAGWLRDWTTSAQAPVLFAAVMLLIVIVMLSILRALQSRWPIAKVALP